MDQYLEDLHNSVNQYSPSDQRTVLQCHAWGQTFIAMKFSDCILKILSRNSHLLGFNEVPKKNIHN